MALPRRVTASTAGGVEVRDGNSRSFVSSCLHYFICKAKKWVKALHKEPLEISEPKFSPLS